MLILGCFRSGDSLDFSLGACPLSVPLSVVPQAFKNLPPHSISHVGFPSRSPPMLNPPSSLDGPCIQLPTSFSLGEPRPELTATEVSEYSSRQDIITGWRPPTCMAPRAGGMLTITDPQGLKESSSLNASSVKKTSLASLSGALRVVFVLEV